MHISDKVSDEELQSFQCNKGHKVRVYNESSVSMDFAWAGDPRCPIPLCIVCGKQFTNAAIAPGKLKRDLTTNHNRLTSKGAYYFKQLLESQKQTE
jgi:hypothetical protein